MTKKTKVLSEVHKRKIANSVRKYWNSLENIDDVVKRKKELSTYASKRLTAIWAKHRVMQKDVEDTAFIKPFPVELSAPNE